jgi:DNA-binding MarR family transcriptional regulator
VTLNNDPTPNSTSTRPGRDAGSPEIGRDALIVELVEEMTSWSPRERINVFRSWLKGSLSLIHLHVLTVLEADGPLPMSHLAETLDVSVASTTGIIGRMEERGLVERSHGEADRRVVIVRPTEAGTAIFRDMTEHRRQSLTHLFGRLTDTELSALLTGLRAMRAARLALHVEKAKEGLVAVTLAPAGTDDAAIAAENAAKPTITGGRA